MAEVREFDLIGLEEKSDNELMDIAKRINEWKTDTAIRSDYVGYKTAYGLKEVVSKEFKKRGLKWP